MALANYGTLRDVIQHQRESLDVRSYRLKWAQQIADAMTYLYSMGVMHHDLKSSNILVLDSPS